MEFEYRNITKVPPTEDELRKIAKLGGYTIQQLLNTKGQTYKKLKPDLSTMEEEEIIAFIQANPSVMIRPVLMDNSHVVTGFKEEAYEEFLHRNP
ncbi:MAG TPA: arsenate reductase family protein [Peptococcaceae bacterium]|nr:arsenate reductase family protein [Peptococcaceae bacterium]